MMKVKITHHSYLDGILVNYFARVFFKKIDPSASLFVTRKPSLQSLLAVLIINMEYSVVVILLIIIWQALINTNWYLVREVVI